MTRKGRKPLAAGHVEHLSGSERAKRRLSMILRTMLGEMTVAEACQQLGIGESRFHTLRNDWLQESLELLEPRRIGRPPKSDMADDSETGSRIAQLQNALQQAEQALEVVQVQHEIAAVVGSVRPAANTLTNASSKQPACRGAGEKSGPQPAPRKTGQRLRARGGSAARRR